MSWKYNNNPQAGDLIRVRRKIGYCHFGIALGNNEVIHFAGPEDDEVLNSDNIQIRRANISIFKKDDEIEVKDPFNSPYSRSEIVSRAKEFVGSSTFRGKHYDFLLNNCEHFARYAYYGTPRSDQVTRALAATAIRAQLLYKKMTGNDKKTSSVEIIDLTDDDSNN